MRPLVTLLTDFGLRDAYVAEMKAALLRSCPPVQIIDVTHDVPPQDVLAGSVVLERAVRSFPAGTVHVAVVDPGVGTDRRLLLCRVNGQSVLLPDNGLITWTYRRLGGVEAQEIVWRPDDASHTFHGRDVLAPVAALLAGRATRPSMFRPVNGVRLLDVRPAASLADAAVLYVDSFGNAVTNVPAELVRPGMTVNGTVPLGRTYADAAVGAAIALVGSGGLLEVAVNRGSAAAVLGLRPGDRLRLA